jgi:3'(2'), 5'-bisphosphate nucleotidase
VEGGGAFYESLNGEKIKITASHKSEYNEMVMVKSRSHASEKLMKLIDKYKFKDVKDSGSSIKICLIAHGLADIYFRFGNTNEWDICAAHCVLSEAGGKMTDCLGNSLIYNKVDPLNRNGFIASNNAIHSKFVEMAQETI